MKHLKYGMQFFLGLGLTSCLFANNRANIERQIMVKTQALSQATSETERNRIRGELNSLTAQLSGSSASQAPGNTVAGADKNNFNMHRDTYFFRGPVLNPTNNSPYLDSPYQRGYGTDTYVLEGQPVMSINHPQAYINKVPQIGADPIRNAAANPWETTYNPQPNQGSQFYQQPVQNGYGWMQPPYGVQQPFMGGPMMGTGYQAGYPHMQQGYGAYGMSYPPYGGGYQQGRPTNVVQYQQQALNNAATDAVQRFRHELQQNPLLGNQVQVDVVSKTTLDNGQLQVVVKTVAGVTGQGLGQERVFLYASNGSFLQQANQATGGQSGVAVTQYRISNAQKFEIDKFVAQQGLNQFGDPFGTMYTGGNPLHGTNLQGQNPEDVRHQLILKKFPQLVQRLGITPSN